MSSDLGPARPFPGLRPYEARDHEWFFGREEQSLSLYRLLDRGRLVAVVGSSGSGKSSVVKAGLLPLLDGEEGGADEGRWRFWDLRPGDRPIARLAETLAGSAPADGSETSVAARGRQQRIDFLLRKSSFGLLDALRELGPGSGACPVLLVDQFEEVFRFADLKGPAAVRGARREEAAAFVQLLIEGTRALDSRLRVILTLRSDYLGDCARFHGLPEAVTASQFLVPSLTRDQREQAIRGPIEKAGGTITDELVERILGDSTEELDQLPVLQHALMRTWDQAASRVRLTLKDYESVGGIADALSRHADTLLEEPDLGLLLLPVEQVFRALAELDRNGRAIRRPLAFDQLVAEAGAREADVRTVVDRFRRDDCSFLVPPFVEGRSLDGGDIVDVGHEALIRRWTRMTREMNGLRTGWLADEVADGRTYVALVETARGAAAPQAALLPLDQVVERRSWWQRRPRTAAWADRYGGGIEKVEKLLADSAEALERSTREREEAARHEAANARQAEALRQSRTGRREVLTRTQGLSFLGVAAMAMAMNCRLVYADPPFSWPVLILLTAVTFLVFVWSPGVETTPGLPGASRLSLDQTILAYYVVDLLALAYLIPPSGGLTSSPFTVFLLLLPMNAILLEEPFQKVGRYFAGVLVLAIALAISGTWWPRDEPPAYTTSLAVARILLLAIAFGTALAGYHRLDQQRRETDPLRTP